MWWGGEGNTLYLNVDGKLDYKIISSYTVRLRCLVSKGAGSVGACVRPPTTTTNHNHQPQSPRVNQPHETNSLAAYIYRLQGLSTDDCRLVVVTPCFRTLGR